MNRFKIASLSCTRNAVSPLLTVFLSVLAIWVLNSGLLVREANAVVVIVWMLILLLLHVPVGAAMGIAGMFGILSVATPSALVGLLKDIPYTTTASASMAVLPMFIFMGLILWRAGITTDLYQVAKIWLRWLPGGLAVTSNIAGAGLGAASGSTMGITYALGRIGIPEMLRSGYSKYIALGSVMSSGTIAQLVPPSLLLVLYAGFTETPVGNQLMAGLVPGIVLTFMYCLIIVVVATLSPSTAPRVASDPMSLRMKFACSTAVWPIVAIVVIVVGGMATGIFTATEAGAVGAVLAIAVSLIKKGVGAGVQLTIQGARDTLASVGSLLFVLIGATTLNRYLTLSGAAQWFSQIIKDADFTPITFILVVIVFYLILGMFMDPIPMMLLTVPLLLPTAEVLGWNTLWYGVFVVLMGEIAILTPPVGVLCFVAHRIAQDKQVNLGYTITLVDVFKAALIFIPGALATVGILVAFPEVVQLLQ